MNEPPTCVSPIGNSGLPGAFATSGGTEGDERSTAGSGSQSSASASNGGGSIAGISGGLQLREIKPGGWNRRDLLRDALMGRLGGYRRNRLCSTLSATGSTSSPNKSRSASVGPSAIRLGPLDSAGIDSAGIGSAGIGSVEPGSLIPCSAGLQSMGGGSAKSGQTESDPATSAPHGTSDHRKHVPPTRSVAWLPKRLGMRLFCSRLSRRCRGRFNEHAAQVAGEIFDRPTEAAVAQRSSNSRIKIGQHGSIRNARRHRG